MFSTAVQKIIGHDFENFQVYSIVLACNVKPDVSWPKAGKTRPAGAHLYI
jgi:hypothetical protein